MFKKPAERVHPRELIGEIHTIFGDPVERIFAPDFETVVVGIEANPVAKSGNRVVSVSIPLFSVDNDTDKIKRSTLELLETILKRFPVMAS